MTSPDTVIDDLSAPHPRAANGAVWDLVSDRVMGGVSRGVMIREVVRDRPALRMQGEVSLENNGGFIQ
ncbi:CIA30 family protein, partial [Ralstonia pseudosolanacearum]|uniref:CIA30 family protein n=1 Tax=Ralstonia pseudosolanacearum TaxID=1310165 RepID=UPI003CF16CF2